SPRKTQCGLPKAPCSRLAATASSLLVGVGDRGCIASSPRRSRSWLNVCRLILAKIIHTETPEEDRNMMFVHTQHQYIPRYHILRHLDAKELEEIRNEFRLGQLLVVVVGSFFIPGTQFVSVTQYKNAEVAEVKIDENPFVGGRRKRKRGGSSASSLS
uniref:T-box domain-containing protein n=1 Tax=Mesocestoides corti TaxID=53468 RepID=A0A5K3G3B5_MESCO